MNNFETKILTAITPLLKEGETAKFFNYSLFVECSMGTLSRIARACTDTAKSPIDIFPIDGREYAIDFV